MGLVCFVVLKRRHWLVAHAHWPTRLLRLAHLVDRL